MNTTIAIANSNNAHSSAWMMRALLLALVGVSVANGQLLFSVKPGLTGNSAQFGLKLSGLMAFGGIEFARVATTSEETGQRLEYYYNYPYYGYNLVSYNNKVEATTNIYTPFVGAKILFGGGETGKTGAYVTGIIGKPFITGKSVDNGKESESTKKFFDGLSAWMFMAGFGGEYFFSESFSIGGEFGLRVFLLNYKTDDRHTETVYDPQTNTYKTYSLPNDYKLDLGLGITYSTIVLNYYL